MKKEAAAQVVDLFIEFGARLDQSVSLVQQSSSESELKTYRRSVGKLMGRMLLEIMNPIFEAYPDLKPEGLEELPRETGKTMRASPERGIYGSSVKRAMHKTAGLALLFLQWGLCLNGLLLIAVAGNTYVMESQLTLGLPRAAETADTYVVPVFQRLMTSVAAGLISVGLGAVLYYLRRSRVCAPWCWLETPSDPRGKGT
ncbi:MAG: hypothetical protein AAFN16_05225 [Pseudomonadota bacterium]